MNPSSTPGAAPDLDYDTLRRNTLFATPLTLLVPVAFALVLARLGADLRWSGVAFGALGWVGALILRAPLAAIFTVAMGGDQDRVKPVIVGSSGPAEEIVRLIVLLMVGRTFSDAASIGIGWAAIEIVYTAITGFITLTLVRRTDPEAMEARAMLESQGMIRETGPWLGIVERIGASALHIGFTLIIAWSAIWTIAAAIIHSAVNLSLIQTFKRWPLLTELALLVVGLGVFSLGVTVLG